jgi:hypothetical protein
MFGRLGSLSLDPTLEDRSRFGSLVLVPVLHRAADLVVILIGIVVASAKSTSMVSARKAVRLPERFRR